MKNVAGFTAVKIKDGYEVFVYWEKRYKFPSLRLANKFVVAANSMLFTELFKVNELLIEIFPDAQRLMFTASPIDKIHLMERLNAIQEMLRYCHFAQTESKTVYVIGKIEQCYSDLKAINDIVFANNKKSSNTVNVYKSKIFAERLESNIKDFMDFKFIRLEKLVKDEPVTHLTLSQMMSA